MARLETPDISQVADDWEAGAGRSAQKFAENAAAAADKWLTNASSDTAQQNYEQAMADPEVLKRRQSNTGDTARQKYSTTLQNVGQGRYSSGVSNAKGTYSDAFGSILQAVEGTNLPERGRPMSQENIDRFRAVIEAFHNAGQQA